MITRSKQHSTGASFQALLSSANISALPCTAEPSSIHQDMQYPLWKSVVQAELQSLVDNGTWTLVRLPTGRTPKGVSGYLNLNFVLMV